MESKKEVRIKIFKAIFLTMIISVILTATFLINFSERLGLVNFLYFKNKSLSTNTLNDITNSSTGSTDATLQLGATLASLKSFINENYDGTYDEDKMIETAIKGYVEGLGDKYSEYITKEEYKEFYTNYVSGEYCGVGIYVVIDEEADKVIVLAPMPGGSAEAAGIVTGDYIIGVDDKEGYTSKDLDEVTDKMKDGEEGSTVNVKIEKKDGTTKTYTLTRKKINLTLILTCNLYKHCNRSCLQPRFKFDFHSSACHNILLKIIIMVLFHTYLMVAFAKTSSLVLDA